MVAQKEDSNGILLERLADLLVEKNTFNSNFINGIAEGEVFEYSYKYLVSPPGAPKELSEEKYKLEIKINPDSYLERPKNKYFNNDFEEITEAVNQLNKIQNKSISKVVVKPKIDDDTFLSVIGEVIRSRKTGEQYFNSKFIDGFSEGKWKIKSMEEPELPLPGNMKHKQTSSTVIKNELTIELPFENFQHKKTDFHKKDDNYLLGIAREIKHFPDEIDSVKVKPI